MNKIFIYVKVIFYVILKYQGNEFSMWDKIDISISMTLPELIEHFKKTYKLKIKQLYYDGSETVSLYFEELGTENMK